MVVGSWGITSHMTQSELTPKQEAFVLEIVKGSSQSDAYRVAFNTNNMKANSIHVNASKLMANTKVALRIKELMAPLIAQIQVTRLEWMKKGERLFLADVRKMFDLSLIHI